MRLLNVQVLEASNRSVDAAALRRRALVIEPFGHPFGVIVAPERDDERHPVLPRARAHVHRLLRQTLWLRGGRVADAAAAATAVGSDRIAGAALVEEGHRPTALGEDDLQAAEPIDAHADPKRRRRVDAIPGGVHAVELRRILRRAACAAVDDGKITPVDGAAPLVARAVAA